MTLTVTSPTAGTRIGPGSDITVHTDMVGPIPNDDFYAIYAYSGGGARYHIWSTTVLHGQRDKICPIGISEKLGFFAAIPFSGLADGASFQFRIEQYHNDGVIVETSFPSTSFAWDATSNLWRLVGVPPVTGDSAKIDQILAAVYRSFPTP